MNKITKFALINLFLLSATPSMADDSLNQYGSQQTATNTQNLVEYLVNLGGYLGFDIKKSPTENNVTINQGLINLSATQIIQTYMYSTFLGAIPVNSFSVALAQYLPTQLPGASAINGLANSTFTAQMYSNPSSQQQGKVSVNTNIDQQTFQQDPVGQAVLNVLGTPDVSYCMNYDKTAWVGCSSGSVSYLTANSVMANIIGPIPSTNTFFTYQYNQQFLSQLNSNTLTSPLLYSVQNGSANSTSSSPNSQNTGLAAQNQAQQAANFIRYVSGSVMPIQLPDRNAYDTVYNQANPSTSNSNSAPTIQQIKAQGILSSYFASLRTYAAQYSVGMSNLYFIMSKRLPQNPTGSNSQSGSSESSQALSEFKLSTWRLFNPDMSTNNQWINQINAASPATVEKEIATLLAEISYQMYLERQIQERILLTNSVMLIQNTRQTQPTASFNGEPGSSPLQ